MGVHTVWLSLLLLLPAQCRGGVVRHVGCLLHRGKEKDVVMVHFIGRQANQARGLSAQRGPFRTLVDDSSHMTVQLCVLLCWTNRFASAALQDGTRCLCAATAEGLVPTDSAMCYQPCSGNCRQHCGGPIALSVYNTGYERKLEPIAKKADVSKGLMGCYKAAAVSNWCRPPDPAVARTNRQFLLKEGQGFPHQHRHMKLQRRNSTGHKREPQRQEGESTIQKRETPLRVETTLQKREDSLRQSRTDRTRILPSSKPALVSERMSALLCAAYCVSGPRGAPLAAVQTKDNCCCGRHEDSRHALGPFKVDFADHCKEPCADTRSRPLCVGSGHATDYVSVYDTFAIWPVNSSRPADLEVEEGRLQPVFPANNQFEVPLLRDKGQLAEQTQLSPEELLLPGKPPQPPVLDPVNLQPWVLVVDTPEDAEAGKDWVPILFIIVIFSLLLVLAILVILNKRKRKGHLPEENVIHSQADSRSVAPKDMDVVKQARDHQ